MAGATFKTLATANELAAPGAGGDILAAVTIKRTGILHVTVSVDTATIVSLKVTDGVTAHELDLNGGVALNTLTVYTFPVPAVTGFTYSLVIKTGETDSTIPHANFLLETPVG